MENEKRNPGCFTPENAREMQLRGAKVKSEKKKRREILEDILNEGVKVITEGGTIKRSKGEQIIRGLVDKALDKDLDAVKLVLKVTGELTDKHDVTSGGQPLNIVVRDEETKRLIDGLADEQEGI